MLTPGKGLSDQPLGAQCRVLDRISDQATRLGIATTVPQAIAAHDQNLIFQAQLHMADLGLSGESPAGPLLVEITDAARHLGKQEVGSVSSASPLNDGREGDTVCSQMEMKKGKA